MDVKPEGDSKDCRVGSGANLTLRVIRSPGCNLKTPVFYKIEDKPDVWAVTGNCSGICVSATTHVFISLCLIPSYVSGK